jgi:L-malate glycosyltransferase
VTLSAAPGVTEASLSRLQRSLPSLFLMTDSFSTGGSERQFVALAREVDPSRFRVDVGCVQKRGELLAGFESAIEFPLGGNLYGPSSWRMRLRLARHLRRNRISVAHAFDFYTNVALLPVARLARVPVVIGSHRQLGDLLGSAKFNAQLLAFQFCDRIVCNSRAAVRILIDNGIPERKLDVIRNGLPEEAFAPAEPALPKLPGVLRVGMIARMNTPAKNHALFIEAAARIASRFPNVEFVLVGDGAVRADLERQVEQLGLDNRVIFLGDRRDIPEVLAALDLSVLPSRSESLSNSILESMAAGVPVIASEVGGNPELLGERRGMLIKPGDCNVLARAIESALLDPGWRQQTSDRARKFASENLRLADASRRYEELYDELLAEKNWHPTQSCTSKLGRCTRVVIVAASPRYVGGQSVQAELLERSWRDDPEVEASFVAIDPSFPRWLQWVNSFPGIRTLFRLPIYLSDLWRAFENADIAHVFSASYWSFLVAPVPAWIAARARGAKVLIHYHSGEARDHLRRSGLARYVLSRVDKVVVPSNFLVDVFREFGIDAESAANMIDLSEFRFRKREPLRPHLVCTRGFHPYYCVDVVVRAFAEVQKQYPQAQLDLLGAGPTEGEIRKLVSELRLANVRFAGVVSREKIGDYYDQADIFINASRLDNMPVSVLEAYAAGLPVVSTAPEGICYVVENGRTGLLSEVGNPSALAANVVRLLDDPQLASNLTVNALQKCKQYEWRVLRQKWLAVYESLVGVAESH